MSKITDEEAWRVILDNQPLFYHFCRKRSLPDSLLDDLVGETQLLVFRRLKAGDLAKASLSHIINFAVKRTSYELHGSLVSQTKVSTSTYRYIGDISRILAENESNVAVPLIRERYFPRMNDSDVTYILNNMYGSGGKVVPKAKLDDSDKEFKWEEVLSSNDGLPEDFTKDCLFEILKRKKPVLMNDELQQMYILGRRYGVEKELGDIYPGLFKKLDPCRYNEEPSVRIIAEELKVSSATIRNWEIKMMKTLSRMVS
jgi:hypothetical protein